MAEEGKSPVLEAIERAKDAAPEQGTVNPFPVVEVPAKPAKPLPPAPAPWSETDREAP